MSHQNKFIEKAVEKLSRTPGGSHSHNISHSRKLPLVFLFSLHLDYELEISITWYNVHVNVPEEGAASLWEEEKNRLHAWYELIL